MCFMQYINLIHHHHHHHHTPESLYIPGTRAYYTLVSLTFHHAQRVPTPTPYPGEAGHFTSWLHHIGGSDVLAYNDLDGGIWHPATPKQSKEFSSGKMRHAPAAAIYYLVGGEATVGRILVQYPAHLYIQALALRMHHCHYESTIPLPACFFDQISETHFPHSLKTTM